MPSYDPGDGHMLHYEEAGAGRPLVLLHGWACHGGFFGPQLEALSDRFRVVAPDLRGHRRSHRPGDAPDLPRLADDLKSLLDRLGPPAPILVSWSMGALVAFEFARRYGSDRLAGLVVVDMTPRVVNGADWSLGLSGGYNAAQAARAPALIRDGWRQWVDAFLPAVLAAGGGQGGGQGGGLLEWIAGEMRDADPDTMAALWRAITDADYRGAVATIAVPTLVVHGAASQLYRPETSAWLASAIPGAVRAAVPQAGHAPHLERPAAFNAVLSDFALRIG